MYAPVGQLVLSVNPLQSKWLLANIVSVNLHLTEFLTLEVAAFHAVPFLHIIVIWPNLELKTRPKQLLGSLPLDIVLPAFFY